FIDQLSLVLPSPFVVRLKRDEHFIAIGTERISSRIVASRLRTHELHFRRLPYQVPHVACNLRGFRERCSRRQIRPDPDNPFVKLWKELGSKKGRQQKSRSHDSGRESNDAARFRKCPLQDRAITAKDPAQ